MTEKQKRFLAILAATNVVIITMLVVAMTRSSRSTPQRGFSTLTPPYLPSLTASHVRAAALAREDCQWQAAQLLAQAGLGGTATLTPAGVLGFEIIYPDVTSLTTSGNRSSVDKAAQSVWTAFDIALALHNPSGKTAGSCGTFSQVDVTILVHTQQAEAELNASVSATDLTGYDGGELSEEAFISRVDYTVSIIRDE